MWLGVSTFWGRLNARASIAYFERVFAATGA
jgi:hypothetical protein